jgi:hypothetical protein
MKKTSARWLLITCAAFLLAAPLAAQKNPVEKERVEFKALMLQNPNYFGNLKKSPFSPSVKISTNTKYEELTCLGFNPGLDMIEAIVQVKLPNGYSGSLCSAGSREYIRFFIDYGSGWENVGLTAINVHDIPNAVDCARNLTKPLSYAAACHLSPKRRICSMPVLPKVRAVLSWEAIPPEDDPDWLMVWGNSLDKQIQIRPRPWFIADLVENLQKGLKQKLELPTLFEEAPETPIPLPDPPPLTLSQLAKLYKPAADARPAQIVEPHRFGFCDIQASLEGSIQSQALAQKIAFWKELNLNWQDAVGALLATSGNTSYEELECLGLDYNQEWLAATVKIKKPSGYSGNLCTAGSKEYVAFWADFENTCQWQYLGTADFTVHDISSIPAEGLQYLALKRVNLNAYRKPCSNPKIVRLRAVLSWQTPPSTTDPEKIPYWGNRRDTHIQIRPGAQIPPNTPVMWTIGGIFVDQIHQSGAFEGMTTSGATFAYNGLAPDPLGRNCPFSGRVVVTGLAIPGAYYRVREHELPGGAWVNVVTKLENLRDMNFVMFTNAPVNPEGFFAYKENVEDILARWDTTGDALHEIKLELASLPDESHILTSVSYVVQLDNTYPQVDIHIDSGGDCKDFLNVSGAKIMGHYFARDAHFGYFNLYCTPYDAPSGQLIPDNGTVPTAISPGDPWTLITAGMAPCGYVLVVWAKDLAIVNSTWVGHESSKAVGFCLRQNP